MKRLKTFLGESDLVLEESEGHTTQEIDALHKELRDHIDPHVHVKWQMERKGVVHHNNGTSSMHFSTRDDLSAAQKAKKLASEHLKKKGVAHTVSRINNALNTYRPEATFHIKVRRKGK